MARASADDRAGQCHARDGHPARRGARHRRLSGDVALNRMAPRMPEQASKMAAAAGAETMSIVLDHAPRPRRLPNPAHGARPTGWLADYLTLMKPRVMSLVVFTAVVGLLVSPVPLHPLTAIGAVPCIAAGAGAAGALNMRYDADIDAVMTRTAARPIPAGRARPA